MSKVDPYITAPARGRARSSSMHEDTHSELLDDLDALNGIAPSSSSSKTSGDDGGSAANSSSSRSSRRRTSREGASDRGGGGKLSQKTISMLTNLEEAVKTVPFELEHTVERVLSEEELAEQELAEQERRKRHASTTSDPLGGGGSSNNSVSGGNSHSSSASAAGGGALSSSAAASGGLASLVAPMRGISLNAGSGGVGSGGSSSDAAAPGSIIAPSSTATAGGRRRPAGPNDKGFDYLVKLLLLGDSGVGKTSLLLRYSDDKFQPSLLSTAGVDYKTQMLDIDGQTVKCQIWDTAGQQRFHVITQAYYRGAHGIVLVYDASDASEASFHNVRYWMENISKHASAGVCKMLLGNKIDVKGRKVGAHSDFFSNVDVRGDRTRSHCDIIT